MDPVNKTKADMARMLVDQTVDAMNKEKTRFQPVILTEVVSIQSRTLSYIDFLVPGILSLMMMSNNLNGVAATIASWRERGILRRMQGTPLKSSTFIAGQMTARILLNAVQVIVVLLVAFFLFDVHVYGIRGHFDFIDFSRDTDIYVDGLYCGQVCPKPRKVQSPLPD